MSTDIPVDVALWAKRTVGWGKVAQVDLNDIPRIEVAPRFNRPGAWSMQIPWAQQSIPMSKKHLVTIDFRGTRETCVVENFGALSDEDGAPLLEVSGLTGLTFVSDALGWPSPGRAIDDQVSVRWYQEGVAETVLRDFVVSNLVDRLGYEIAAPSSQGRGTVVTVNSEFTNVLEILSDKATLAGIGVRLGLENTTSATRAALTLRFYEPVDRTQRAHLSSKVGNLVSWKQSDTVPTATRAIIQAAREKQGRQLGPANLANNTLTTLNDRRTSNREVRSVSVANNTITTKSAHEMPTGALIQITQGTAPAPLERDTDYYAIKVDSDTLKVARTREAADAGNAVAITSEGSGQLVVTRVRTRPIKHKLRTGDIISFSGGTPPEPLEPDLDYHAIRVDDNTFAVAMTRSDAAKDIRIDLTNRGEGDVSVTESTRFYRSVTRTKSEDEWGRKREVLVVGNGEDRPTALDEQGRDALRDGASQSAFELETTEVPGMRYGDPIQLGDTVTIALPTGETRTDVIGGVSLSITESDGLVVQMIPGDPDATNPQLQQAADIRRIRRKASRARED